MIACYDLARCPPTYDVVAFLALLELERIRRGEEYSDLHILPGPAGGFRQDGLWPKGLEARVAMRENVLVPLCRLLPSVRSVEVRSDRGIDGWGKGAYYISLPAIVKALKSDSRPLRPAGNWVPRDQSRKLITFTLREAEHHPLRNSHVDEWALAAMDLAEVGYAVHIIRDTRMATVPLVGDRYSAVDQIADAPLDIGKRAVNYTSAALNVGICNGPIWMSIFMDAPTLMLRPTTNEAGGCYDDKFYARWGLPRGSQLPTSPPHQRLVWENDTRDNIVRAVEEMMAVVG